jgi:Na+/melibiose symporter-like transporter
LFLTGIVPPGKIISVGESSFPLALWSFVALHASYWLGTGIMMTVATAMIADLSEIHRLQTGFGKDGSYAAVFSLVNRLACSIGMITSGCGLHLIGYKATRTVEAAGQSSQSIWWLGFVTFGLGGFMCLASLLCILRYPVTSRRLEEMRTASLSQTQLHEIETAETERRQSNRVE